MTTEQMINDVRVVFRDGIGAKFGWDLIGPMNRFTEAMAAKTLELQGGDENADKVFIPGGAVVELVHDALGWKAAVLLVRAAVESWDFPGDLTTDECCDDLDTLGELFPLIVRGRQIYLGVPLSGE